MKLMDIDSEHLGSICTDAEYQAFMWMSSSEFARICKDLSSIGDTGIIILLFCWCNFKLHFVDDFFSSFKFSVMKEGVKFGSAKALSIGSPPFSVARAEAREEGSREEREDLGGEWVRSL
jgi:hypothetical protein